MTTTPALTQNIPASSAPVERCCCCWYVARPEQAYPALWTSTLCPFHAGWYREQRKHRIALEKAGYHGPWRPLEV